MLYPDESGWETTTCVIDENLLPPLTLCLTGIRQLPRFPVAGSRSESFGGKQNDTIQEDSVRWRHLPVPAMTLIFIWGLSGCGFGQFETARTLPVGHKAIVAGISHIVNENSDIRGALPASFPSELKMRFGVHERVDMSVGLFLLTGLQWHIKVNLLPPGLPIAAAMQTGVGGALLPFEDGGDEKAPRVLRAPVNLLVSYDVTDWFSPYAGVGYQFWWFFNKARQADARLQPGYKWAARKGYGDGVVRLAGGVAFRAGEKRCWLMEYAALIPVVNDPGDNFRFVLNHHFGIALQRMF